MKQKKGKFQIVYGRKPILESLAEGQRFERIYIKDSLRGDYEMEVRQKCQEANIPLKRVPQIKLDKLTFKKNHQGIAGIAAILEYQRLEDLVPFVFEKGASPLIVVLDNVQDVRNCGAIARSCEAFGVHGIVLSGRNKGIVNSDAIKSSAGSLLRVPVCRSESTLDTIDILRNSGIKICGSSLNATNSLGNSEMSPPIALILGSEGEGLHPAIEEKCDVLINIPIIGKTESLNVSVAAGIMLYEVMNQSKNLL